MNMRLIMLSFVVLVALPRSANAQAIADLSDSPSVIAVTTPAQPGITYTPPTTKTKLHSYVFEAFGPYPIVGAGLAASIGQADNTPPEWKQGAAGYSKRFGSDFGIAAVTTTTRYALARAFREDTLYYRCECKGVFRRLGHAVISTVTARYGDDGLRRLALATLVAPYAGTMTAAYGWYPNRYGVKDGIRMGNYTLLAFVG